MICEKCWSDAYLRSYGTGKSQYQCYLELLEERKNNPCSPEQQSGLTIRAVDEGGSASLQAKSTPEKLPIEEAGTTPAHRK